MTKITYQVGDKDGFIVWGISEQFNELRGKTYRLDQMAAKQIVEMDDISVVAKILLSAIAGSILQRLMDEGMPIEVIFETGTFEVQ
ncbi:MAG: hypothetical protein LBG64_03855 [Pseudomonadales bacterium]|nr:hypothetical protein [Pseudomonadales bacterium]